MVGGGEGVLTLKPYKVSKPRGSSYPKPLLLRSELLKVRGPESYIPLRSFFIFVYTKPRRILKDIILLRF